MKVKVTQSCPTLWDPMDSTVHGILQAGILKWVAFPFFRGSSQTRDWTQVSRIAGGFFTSWATREAHISLYLFSCKWKRCERRCIVSTIFSPLPPPSFGTRSSSNLDDHSSLQIHLLPPVLSHRDLYPLYHPNDDFKTHVSLSHPGFKSSGAPRSLHNRLLLSDTSAQWSLPISLASPQILSSPQAEREIYWHKWSSCKKEVCLYR